MNGNSTIRSIFWGIVLFLAAACGPREKPGDEPAAVIRPTVPDGAAETLNGYREKGIEPRRARFALEWED
ncbi:MAG: hypothetical protein P9M08_07370 [Candidatus Erginobacter occultus]|nr:hypothetical protein [Candidatus Erginobacter occultus]